RRIAHEWLARWRSPVLCVYSHLARVNMRRILLVSVFAVLLVLAAPSLIQADTVNFDNVVAPAVFIQVPTSSPFVSTGLTLTNGVVLNDTHFGSSSTTSPNLYATTDFHPLADLTLLPGFIVGTFTGGTGSGLSLDVINGFGAADFTL